MVNNFLNYQKIVLDPPLLNVPQLEFKRQIVDYFIGFFKLCSIILIYFFVLIIFYFSIQYNERTIITTDSVVYKTNLT